MNVFVIGRVFIGGAFALIGLINIGNLAPLSELMRARRIPLPAMAARAGVAAQIVLGSLLAIGLWPLAASLGLAVFVVAATAIAHWPFRGDALERQQNVLACLVNLIMLGGLLTQAAFALR